MRWRSAHRRAAAIRSSAAWGPSLDRSHAQVPEYLRSERALRVLLRDSAMLEVKGMLRGYGSHLRRGVPLVLFGLGLILAACSNTSTPATSSSGGIVTFAEQPSAPPNYIFPMESGAYFTFANGEFSPLMYLPLYWFGDRGKPNFNSTLSIAKAPVFSDNNTVVTVTLKHWQWSNGQPITARDVTFWMNLLSAATDPNAPTIGSTTAPGPGYGGAVPGGFPENVVSYAATGTYTVVFRLNASYNPTWFLYNDLSEIYPLPQAQWDRLSSSGPVGNYDEAASSRAPLAGTSPQQYVPASAGTATTGPLGVAQFLNVESQSLSTYTSNPLWRVVDGPFKLSQFTQSGFAKLVPNPAYSGSPKPTIAAFEELPFTSASAEFDALASGSVTIGYIPTTSLTDLTRLEKQHGYAYSPWYAFGFNAIDFNFTNPAVGPLFKELYFRQAFQSLINQTQYIHAFSAGIGTVTNGPVPTYPPGNSDESPLEAKGLVYPYNPTKAVSLLRAHGWTVVARGVSYCSRPGTAPGECGEGISAHQRLNLSLLYPSGSPSLDSEMAAMQSVMKKFAGIDIALREQPVNQVTNVESAGCSTASPCSTWELSTEANTGVSWVYYPDFFPTGGEMFLTGASSNHGYYSSKTADALIAATHTAPNSAAERQALYQYEDYLARQLPEAWMPASPYQLTLYKRGLKGLVPQGIFTELYPQYYSLGR